MIELMINLQGGAKAPLYEKIYQHIKNGRAASVHQKTGGTFDGKPQYGRNGI